MQTKVSSESKNCQFLVVHCVNILIQFESPPTLITNAMTFDIQAVILCYKRYSGAKTMVSYVMKNFLKACKLFHRPHIIGYARFINIWLMMKVDDKYILRNRKLFLALEHIKRSQSNIIQDINILQLTLIRSSKKTLEDKDIIDFKNLPQNMKKKITRASILHLPNDIKKSSSLLEKYEICLSNPEMVAKAITEVEQLLLSKVPLTDFNDKAWMRPTEKRLHLLDFIEHNNVISAWVSTLILRELDFKAQAHIFSWFVKIAFFCNDYGNFSSCSAIISGCERNQVSRLFDKWNISTSKIMQLYKYLVRIYSPKNNYIVYRRQLDKYQGKYSHNNFIIPHIAVCLRDLVYIEDGNNDYCSDGTINLKKIELLRNSFRLIHFASRNKYKFEVNIPQQMLQYLKNPPVMDEEFFEKRSNELKPRIRSNTENIISSEEPSIDDTDIDEITPDITTINEDNSSNSFIVELVAHDL